MIFTVEFANPCTCEEALKKRISEVGFAATDLNLFLDTHPHCQEALDLYKKCVFTLKSLTKEYVSKYGPLKACDSKDTAPFEWVDASTPWPWEKEV